MISFDGQVVVVTGAGNGLGRAHALEFARRGAAVVVNDFGCAIDGGGQSRDAADAVVEDISASGGRAIGSYASVSTVEGGEAIIQAAISEFGRLDALVVNAGILSNAPFEEMSVDLLQRVIATNLIGAIYVAQPAYRLMRDQRGGRIVFTSSGAGLFGARNGANYSASKAGLLGLSQTIAIEGAGLGITSNIVLPSAATRMVAGIRPQDIGESGMDRPPAQPESALALGPEFVTPLVIYLASKACAVNQEVFSAVKGRFARAFVAVTSGWFAPSHRPATPEEIEQHLEEIRNAESYSVPGSVYEEVANVTARLASTMKLART